jgi:regulator of nucleoside diphosphate kinase
MTPLIINKLDYQRLRMWAERAKSQFRFSNAHFDNMLRKAGEATLVEPEEIPADVVTMNSRICLRYINNNETKEIQLVYPESADIKRNRISIFAPLATTLLGCKQGSLAILSTPNGTVRVLIDKILYQPEAAGDFTL